MEFYFQDMFESQEAEESEIRDPTSAKHGWQLASGDWKAEHGPVADKTEMQEARAAVLDFHSSPKQILMFKYSDSAVA